MGYLGANAYGSNICLRNGQVVLPIADREVFGEYLKIMNQLYEEELIHPDFFTMDQSTTSAFLAEGVIKSFCLRGGNNNAGRHLFIQ